MNKPIIVITSYTSPTGYRVKGIFPFYVGGISQCCLDSKNKQTITPVNFIVS